MKKNIQSWGWTCHADDRGGGGGAGRGDTRDSAVELESVPWLVEAQPTKSARVWAADGNVLLGS